MSFEHEMLDFGKVEKAFGKLIASLKSDMEKIVYVKPSGLFDRRINAQNIQGLSSYGALRNNSEHFGITPEEGVLITRYLNFDDEYDFVEKLHSTFDLDEEHGSFMKTVNMRRRVRGAIPMDRKGMPMDENSEEYRRIFGVN